MKIHECDLERNAQTTFCHTETDSLIKQEGTADYIVGLWQGCDDTENKKSYLEQMFFKALE